MFSIQQIKYFATVAEQGSLSAAAKELDVTVQAVSRGLIEFEQHFDEDLFVRRSHGVDPTPFGRKLYYKARDILHGVADLETCEADLAGKRSGAFNLMLCSPPFATRHIVNKHVASFIQRSLDVEAKVSIGYVADCASALAAGTIDAFVTLGSAKLPEFDVLQIGTVSTGALLMEFEDLAKKPGVTLADFDGRPLCLTPEFNFFSESVAEEYARRGIEVQFAKADLTLLDTYRVLAREHGGFVVPAMPEFGELFPGAVIRPFEAPDAVVMPICLVSRKDDKTPACLALELLLTKSTPSLSGIKDLLLS